MPGQAAVGFMIEFLDAGLTREDQCGRVDAKPTGYCASSVVPFGKTAGFLFAWWSAGAGWGARRVHVSGQSDRVFVSLICCITWSRL
jgi:hypothetical protein